MCQRTLAKITAQYRGDIRCELRRVRFQEPPDLGFVAQHRLDRKIFVMKPEYRFDHVRKRTVPDVVQQRRDANRGLVILRNVIFRAKPVQHPPREVKRPERMRKPRVLGALICKIRQPQLTYPPQPLKLRRVDQACNQIAFRRIDL